MLGGDVTLTSNVIDAEDFGPGAIQPPVIGAIGVYAKDPNTLALTHNDVIGYNVSGDHVGVFVGGSSTSRTTIVRNRISGGSGVRFANNTALVVTGASAEIDANSLSGTQVVELDRVGPTTVTNNFIAGNAYDTIMMDPSIASATGISYSGPSNGDVSIAHNTIYVGATGTVTGIHATGTTGLHMVDNLMWGQTSPIAHRESIAIAVVDGTAEVVRNAYVDFKAGPSLIDLSSMLPTSVYDGNPVLTADCTGLASCIACDSACYAALNFGFGELAAGLPCALTTGASGAPAMDIVGNLRSSMSPYGAWATTAGACKP